METASSVEEIVSRYENGELTLSEVDISIIDLSIIHQPSQILIELPDYMLRHLREFLTSNSSNFASVKFIEPGARTTHP